METETKCTATFFYSEKQKQSIDNSRLSKSIPFKKVKCFIDGKEYTELMTHQKNLPHTSNFDDAVIVAQFNDLPEDEFHKRHFNGDICVDIRSLKITYNVYI